MPIIQNAIDSDIKEISIINIIAGAFTCPQCFSQLPNAEALQRHFRDQHELTESRSDGDLLTMQLEMKDLRTAIQVCFIISVR